MNATTDQTGTEGQETKETTEEAPPEEARPVDPKETWNLTDVFASDQDWGDAVTVAQQRLSELDKLPGTLGKSPAALLEALDTVEEQAKEIMRIGGYAQLQSDADLRNPEALQMVQQAGLLQTDFSKKLAFMNPELLRVGKKKIDRFIAREPKLEVYRHFFDNVLRKKPHTLDAKGEGLLAASSLISDTPETFYQILTSAELPWPTITLPDGTKVRLDQAAYTRYRASNDRDVRKMVFDAFFGKWKEYEQTMGVSLYALLKTHFFYAQARNYKSCLARALDKNRVPASVYHMLIDSANKDLPTLYRYLKLRARMLGIKELKYHDLYPPIVKSDDKYTIDEAKKLTLAAVAPLGDDYAAPLKYGFEHRWMDTYPHQGKRSGAYSMGTPFYDVHPYVLMNFNDDWEGVTTLAHEWGHTMHSYFSNKNQPFVNANYAIFVAEVASTFNEGLLSDYALKHAKSDDEKLYYLGTALEGLRTTYFRQTMFAEFELKIHELVEKGEALSGKRLSQIYLDLLRKYHGHDKGVMNIEDEYAIEWAYIPHFYYDFYVYQYATSIAASSLLVQKVLSGDEGTKAKYLTLLKSGGMDYPYELLKKAGVDMATPEPYEAINARMNKIMDEIEAILDRKEGN